MKYRFEFTIEERKLEQIVKSINKIFKKENIEPSRFDFEKLKPNSRASYLVVFAVLGLLRSGCSEEKTLEILKTLFDISINNEDLSPGNLKDIN